MLSKSSIRFNELKPQKNPHHLKKQIDLVNLNKQTGTAALRGNDKGPEELDLLDENIMASLGEGHVMQM